jgi:hypothetical protein
MNGLDSRPALEAAQPGREGPPFEYKPSVPAAIVDSGVHYQALAVGVGYHGIKPAPEPKRQSGSSFRALPR